MEKTNNLIEIKEVTKVFGSFKAIDNISLNIPNGSFTTLLGPSGCGKTTLLRLIAGFYEPDRGDILIDGASVNGLPPYKRNTPLVFQDYALFPHMTVFENISYGLKIHKLSKKVIAEKVAEMLKTFSLEGLEKRYPKQLSGGQQQRVAFARAVVMGKKILLLDEPLSNLDAKLRFEVREELKALQKRIDVTMVYVTHDQDEALSMSDFIAVLNKGKIIQTGSPWELYYRPVDLFVAGFIGMANFIDAEVNDVTDDGVSVKCGEIPLMTAGSSRMIKKGDRVKLLIRPECISLSSESEDIPKENSMKGRIVGSTFLGRTARYHVEYAGGTVTVEDPATAMHGLENGRVMLSFNKSRIHILPDEVYK